MNNFFDDHHPLTEFARSENTYFDLRVFDQNTYWVNFDEPEPLTLEKMGQDELLFALEFLFNRAEYFYDIYLTAQRIVSIKDYLLGFDKQEDTQMRNLLIDDMMDKKPHEWLNNTILVRKINELLD